MLFWVRGHSWQQYSKEWVSGFGRKGSWRIRREMRDFGIKIWGRRMVLREEREREVVQKSEGLEVRGMAWEWDRTWGKTNTACEGKDCSLWSWMKLLLQLRSENSSTGTWRDASDWFSGVLGTYCVSWALYCCLQTPWPKQPGEELVFHYAGKSG